MDEQELYHVSVADASPLCGGWMAKGNLARALPKIVQAQGLTSYAGHETNDESTTFGAITTVYFRNREDMEWLRDSLREGRWKILDSGRTTVADY